MMIHILLVQTLRLQLQSILICLVNVTLTAKSALHTSQFMSRTAAIYHTALGLEKMLQRTDRQRKQLQKPI